MLYIVIAALLILAVSVGYIHFRKIYHKSSKKLMKVLLDNEEQYESIYSA
ncbi:MAG: hypothetical protein ACOX6S_11380 [Clostridia bacterium]|jgi:hypothetical protein